MSSSGSRTLALAQVSKALLGILSGYVCFAPYTQQGGHRDREGTLGAFDDRRDDALRAFKRRDEVRAVSRLSTSDKPVTVVPKEPEAVLLHQ